jgi:HAD superfamily hydrolase (TIGR01490 family)
VPASYFDVYGTLVSSNLVHPALYYLVNQATPWQSAMRLGRSLLKAPAMAVAELVDRRLFNELLFSAYDGISEDRLLLLADEVFERIIRPSLYPGARDLVTRARDAGHEIVLVSGTLDFILERLGRHLGGATLIANRLEMKDRHATGKLQRPVVAGPIKAQLVRHHARKNQHDLDDCFAYSDSYSDVPMLSTVGHPAAVNPDIRLKLLAKSYGWPSFKLTAVT